jgi:hypothetical protein
MRMRVRIRGRQGARVRMQKRVSVGLGKPETKRRGSSVGRLKCRGSTVGAHLSQAQLSVYPTGSTFSI